jgi:hypothetical protein
MVGDHFQLVVSQIKQYEIRQVLAERTIYLAYFVSLQIKHSQLRKVGQIWGLKGIRYALEVLSG